MKKHRQLLSRKWQMHLSKTAKLSVTITMRQEHDSVKILHTGINCCKCSPASSRFNI